MGFLVFLLVLGIVLLAISVSILVYTFLHPLPQVENQVPVNELLE